MWRGVLPVSDGPIVRDFIQACCRVTEGEFAGQPLRLRPWQVRLVDDLFELRDDRLRRFRRGLIGLPRKNGKSALGSAVALFGLILDGEPGAQVYSCAGDRKQARIVFDAAKRMVQMDPDLTARTKLYRDAIEVPATGSVYRVLSADAKLQEGLNPSMVIFDEVHIQPTDELWNVMSLGSGTRRQPLLLGITTAGVMSDRTGGDSLCYRLYQHGKKIAAGEVEDPTFFFRWWEPADPDADHRDPAVWAEANPALGDFLHADDFDASMRTTPEAEFRTKRLNMFVPSSAAWLPYGMWDACHTDRPVPEDGTDIIVGFDGSYKGDSTALVGCTIEGTPHLWVIEAWERKDSADPHWRVDIAEVEHAIRQACARWHVVEVACDPYRWQRSMQALLEEDLPIVEWPTGTPARMVPACAKFYDAAAEQKLSHDGDPRLARHVGNAVLKIDHIGPRIVKDHKDSPRKIDLAVCAVIAHDRATWRQEQQVAPFVMTL